MSFFSKCWPFGRARNITESKDVAERPAVNFHAWSEASTVPAAAAQSPDSTPSEAGFFERNVEHKSLKASSTSSGSSLDDINLLHVPENKSSRP